MNKWTKAARVRLSEIQAAEEGAKDMQTIADAFSKLPPGQRKQVLTQEILAILAKYGITE